LFQKNLKRFGKKDHVVAGLIREVERFEQYLASQQVKNLASATSQNLLDYIAELEAAEKGGSRKKIRALALYYKFIGNDTLAALASAQREQRISKLRTSYPLKDLLGIDPSVIRQLAALGVTNIDQMLEVGSTPAKRAALAEKSGLAESLILELVKLSDLTRLPGVKAIRSRLYYDAGIDTVEKMANIEPEVLLTLTADFVHRTNFNGIAPLPKEVQYTITKAQKLPKVLEI
jgi:hypothetical protein